MLDATTQLWLLWLVANGGKNAIPNEGSQLAAMPFEEALKRLDTIVDAMEQQDLPLETLLQKYEEGTRLSKVCQEKLAQAELRIQQLEKNSAGELSLRPLPSLSEDE